MANAEEYGDIIRFRDESSSRVLGDCAPAATTSGGERIWRHIPSRGESLFTVHGECACNTAAGARERDVTSTSKAAQGTGECFGSWTAAESFRRHQYREVGLHFRGNVPVDLRWKVQWCESV